MFRGAVRYTEPVEWVVMGLLELFCRDPGTAGDAGRGAIQLVRTSSFVIESTCSLNASNAALERRSGCLIRLDIHE